MISTHAYDLRRLPFWATFVLTICIGGISALAMAPLHIWPLLLAGIGYLFYMSCGARRPLHALFIGWGFGFGYFVIGLYWIGNALLVEGNDYKWAWPLAVTGLPALLAFFPAVTLYIAKKIISRRISPPFLLYLLTFFSAMFLAEWLRGHMFTGFPWNLYGYAWGDILPMLQIVHLANIYLLSALTIFWGAALGYVFLEPQRSAKISISALAILSVLLVYAYGLQRLSAAPQNLEMVWAQDGHNTTQRNIELRVIQPNIDQSEKWDRNKVQSHFKTLLRLSAPKFNEHPTEDGYYETNEWDETNGSAKSPTLIVWPETAISYVFLENEIFLSMIREMLAHYDGDVYLATGALLYNSADNSYANSIIILDKSGAIIGRYDKAKLVPFGEYIPYQQWIPLKTITQFAGFQKGDGLQTLNITDNFSVSPLVCYEILFPSAVVKKHSAPNAIINVTNDAWYGFSAGPHQHLLKARIRAIEENITVIRAANTGYSAVIDPYGRYVKKSGLFKEEILYANLGLSK